MASAQPIPSSPVAAMQHPVAPTRPGERDLRIARAILAVVLVAHFALGILYNLASPLFEAPDEIWHYLYVRHVAEGKGLPIQEQRHSHILAQQEAGQPPLYYVVAGALTFWTPRGDMAAQVRENPQGSIGDPTTDGNKNRFVHGAAERFPWGGDVWAVRLARLVATLFGSLTILLTYRIGRELWPARPDLAVGAAAVNAFIPQFLYIGAAVNNDVAAAATSALVLFLSIQLVTHGPSQRRLALASLALSLAILAKLGGVAAIGLPLVALAAWHWRQRPLRPWPRVSMLVRSGVLLLAPVAIATGWWFARNQLLYGELIPLKAFLGRERLDDEMPTLAQVASDLPGLWMSFWALFGWFSVLVHPGVYRFYEILAILALVGLLVGLARQRHGTHLFPPTLLLLVLWTVVVVVALLRYRMIVMAFQGRLLYPAISAIAILLYLGLAALVPYRWRWAAVPAVAVPMLAIATALPFQAIIPAYAPPATTTLPALGAPSHPAVARFGGQIELLGYDLSAESVGPGETLTVTLYWHALGEMAEDYVVFLQLIDGKGGIIAQDDSFPARGAYATSLWSPGQALRDPIRLRIPASAEGPQRARLLVGLYEPESARRQSPSTTLPQEGGAVILGTVRLVSGRPVEVPNPRRDDFAGNAALIGFVLERAVVAPGEAVEGRLFFEGLAPMSHDYTVFVHLTKEPLVDASSVVGQQDQQPRGGAYPTSAWQPGETVAHDFRLPLNADTPPGVYVLRVGLYELSSGRRLPVGDGDHVRLATITVRPR